MGVSQESFGKSGARPTLPKERPREIGAMPSDSRFIAFEGEDGTVMVMPRDMFEYLYDEVRSPDPAQRDIDELLSGVTRVRVLAGGIFRGASIGEEVLVDTSDRDAIADLRRCLEIVEAAPFSRCACFGGPALELFAADTRAATIGLQHGRAIRLVKWRHDAALHSRTALNDWLTANGVDPALLDGLLHNTYDGSGLSAGTKTPLSRAEQRLRLAENRRVKGDVAGALALCEGVLAEHPTLAFAHAVRAMCRRDQGDRRGTIADCTAAIDGGFRSAHVFFVRAVARDMLGDALGAVADCDAALASEPDHTGALNSRGAIRLRSGDLAGALSDLDEAVRLAPAAWLPRMNRAQAHLLRKNVSEASADFDFAIAGASKAKNSDPRVLAMMFRKRGECHLLRGDRAKAAADRKAAAKLDPDPQSAPATFETR